MVIFLLAPLVMGDFILALGNRDLFLIAVGPIASVSDGYQVGT
jgi:hypothetical protein